MKVLLCALTDELASLAANVVSTSSLECLRAKDLVEARGLIQVDAPSLIVVAGPSTADVAKSCRTLRDAASSNDPVILALASDPKRDAPNVFAAGADDFFIGSLGEQGLESKLLVAQRTVAYLALRTVREGQPRCPEHEL